MKAPLNNLVHVCLHLFPPLDYKFLQGKNPMSFLFWDQKKKNVACHYSKQKMLLAIKPSDMADALMVHPEGNSEWRKLGYWP